MANRSRQTWTSMRGEIYNLLRENESENPYWTPTVLLQLLNEERDNLDMILGETYEDWNILSVTTDLIASQAYYMLPNDTNRIMRLTRVLSAGQEVPLERLERWSESSPVTSAVGDGYLPTYRMEDRWIVLEPAPTAAISDGLKIYYERGLQKIDGDDDEVIIPAWPYITETYLKYAVAVAAFEIEGAMGPEAGGIYTSLVKKRDEIEEKLREYCETRSFGRNYGTPLLFGD